MFPFLDSAKAIRKYHKREAKSEDKHHKKFSLENLNEQEEEEECDIKTDGLEINHSTLFTGGNLELKENTKMDQSWYYSTNRLDRIAILVLPPVYFLIVSVYWISYLSRYANNNSIHFHKKL